MTVEEERALGGETLKTPNFDRMASEQAIIGGPDTCSPEPKGETLKTPNFDRMASEQRNIYGGPDTCGPQPKGETLKTPNFDRMASEQRNIYGGPDTCGPQPKVYTGYNPDEPILGAPSAEEPFKNQEIDRPLALCALFQGQLQDYLNGGKQFDQYVPMGCQTQVVSGMNYIIRIKTGPKSEIGLEAYWPIGSGFPEMTNWYHWGKKTKHPEA
ncbi:uncharacterized protein LOC118405442 [Branchiostoma floridae]|uniref:Uncharacterized protein LOC118405442 n=1 Tax=Branchiostoma floridae TaxID=7739 RepID=A0A9J7HJP1_BRAFL|nr:uncharacterized protein LOC118405442 [Branchiostoma floridae]